MGGFSVGCGSNPAPTVEPRGQGKAGGTSKPSPRGPLCYPNAFLRVLCCHAEVVASLAGTAPGDEPTVDGDCSYAVFSSGLARASILPTGNSDYPDTVLVLDGAAGVRRVSYTHWAFAQQLQPLPLQRTCQGGSRGAACMRSWQSVRVPFARAVSLVCADPHLWHTHTRQMSFCSGHHRVQHHQLRGQHCWQPGRGSPWCSIHSALRYRHLGGRRLLLGGCHRHWAQLFEGHRRCVRENTAKCM